MANPENDSPWEITHKIKSSQPNLMILMLLIWGKDALSSKVKKDNCWSEQSPKKSTVPFFGGIKECMLIKKKKRGGNTFIYTQLNTLKWVVIKIYTVCQKI